MTCKHHWRLDEVNGRPHVAGVCLNCGERRDDFKTSIEYSAQNGDSFHALFMYPGKEKPLVW